MPISGVPKGLRRQVLAAFVNALKTNKYLSNNRVVKTWLIWDGTSSIAEVTTDMMPAVQVRMLSGPVERKASTRIPGRPMTHVDVSTPTMMIDLWTPGTDQGDHSDVAELIYRALAPTDADEYGELQEKFKRAGIKDWQLTREIGPSSAESFSLEGIGGTGTYQLTVFFNA